MFGYKKKFKEQRRLRIAAENEAELYKLYYKDIKRSKEVSDAKNENLNSTLETIADIVYDEVRTPYKFDSEVKFNVGKLVDFLNKKDNVDLIKSHLQEAKSTIKIRDAEIIKLEGYVEKLTDDKIRYQTFIRGIK